MIPDFQTIMLPFLEILGDGQEHELQGIIKKISDRFDLTEEERRRLVPSGGQEVIVGRVGWVRTYLKNANLIITIRRAVFKVTQDGLYLLANKPSKIDVKFLQTIPAFQEWKVSQKRKDRQVESVEIEETEITQTPEELIGYSISKIREELISELIDKIKSCSPRFFEKLVIDLLIKIGYGGSLKEAGSIVGKSGDGGIDGIIKEDKLGLDKIYVQAKRWENIVPISQIRDFAGSLLQQKAKKGIFITTSDYPKSAYDFVNNIEHRIVLINGRELAEYMIDYSVGIQLKKTYEIKRIDFDYFEE